MNLIVDTYIVRSITVVERLVSKKYKFDLGKKIKFPYLICNKDHEIFAKQILEKLLHNTIDGFFFVRKDSHPSINEDLCVFLPLSIALRNDHYEVCLASKKAQLDNIFQAKLGWLVGTMYSKVGTPDLEEHMSEPDSYKESFYEDILYEKTAWLSAPQLKILKSNIIDWKKDNPGCELEESQAYSLISSVPDNYEIISKRITQLLVDENFINDDPEIINRVKYLLSNDVSLKKLINSTSK